MPAPTDHPPKIVALDGHTLNPVGDNPWVALAALGDLVVYPRTPIEQIGGCLADADIAITNKAPLSAETIAAAPRLRFIAVTATGYDLIDLAAAKARGIPVANVPEYSTDSVAQLVFALLLELCHHTAQHSAAVHGGAWSASPDFAFWQTPLVELSGMTMGIVGFGRIGRRVGEIAQAFGMHVLAARGRSGREAARPSYEPFATAAAAEVFAKADVISLHVPLTPASRGMVNAKLLSTMKPTALLINTSRGALVNEQDLADALRAGTIAGAAVDVLSTEPPAPTNPLLTAPRCIITPHLAWATLAARRRLMKATTENIAAFLRGTPIHIVNP